MDADGSNPNRLTINSANDYLPSWSPDGTKIVYVSTYQNSGGFIDIFIMNADGTNQLNLTNTLNDNFSPSFSPDGSRIMFESRHTGNNELYVMNTDGSNQINITNTPGEDRGGAWSPDGSRIAFYSDRDGNAEIYVMNANGSNQTRITNNSANDNVPSWSSDGSQIVFVSERDGNPEIYVMNADGSSQINLTNNSASDYSPSWTKSGTVETGTLTLTSPTGGESWEASSSHNITWSATDVTSVKLEYSTNNGSSWSTITSSVSASVSTYSWSIPALSSTNCLIRIIDTSDETVKDQNNAVFSIEPTQEMLTLTSPNGGENWTVSDYIGNHWDITWMYTNNSENQVKLEYSTDNGVTWNYITSGVDANKRMYSWGTPPYVNSHQCLVRISDVNYTNVVDVSDDVFTITNSHINLNLSSTQLTFSGKEKKWGTDWSSDGNWISYSEKGDDGLFDIWIVPSSGGEPVKLTENIEGSHSIAYFTPNENKLIFNARGADDTNINNYKIHRINNLNTKENEVLLERAQNAAISNNGQYIVYRVAPSMNLNLWNLANTNIKTIGTEEELNYPIQIFSHDDSHIITQKLINEEVKLVQIPVGGGQFEQLTSIAGDHWYHDISRNGNFILYTELQQNKIWVYNTLSGVSSTVLDKNLTLKNQGASFSPDGSKISFLLETAYNSGIYEVFVADFPLGMLNVTNPNGGENLQAETTQNITWTNTIIDKVMIQFSSDNGANWSIIAENIDANTETFAWTVPNVNSSQCLIKISDEFDTNISDVSDGVFTITSGSSSGDITLTSPNGGEQWPSNSTQTILWTKGNVSYINIDYSPDGGSSWLNVARNILVNTYDWKVPAYATAQGIIRVTDAADSNVWDESDGYFEITSDNFIRIIAPISDDVWTAKSLKEIRWEFSGVDNVKIELSLNDGVNWDTVIAESVQALTGSYQFTVPDTPSADCRIRITDTSNSETFRMSARFEIKQAELFLTHTPLEQAEELAEIEFTANISGTSDIESVTLFYRKAGETSFNNEAMELSNAGNNEYSFTMETGYFTAPGMDYYIVAVDMDKNEARSPVDEGFYSITANILGIKSTDTTAGGIAQNAYRMISVPINFSTESVRDQLMSVPDGTYGNDWRLFRYSPGNTTPEEYPDIEGFSPGKAFWFITKNDYQFNTTGGMTETTSSPFNITLKQGWNDIANPWLFDISWDNIENPSGAQLSPLYTYDGAWSDPLTPSLTMEPWKGYAVYSYSNVNTIIKLNPENSAEAAKPLAEETDIDWMLSINASAGEAKDISNHLGVRPDAETEWDRFDHIEPPVIGEYVSVSFPHDDWEEYPHNYTVDFRPLANTLEWDFDVKTNISGETVVIQFEGINTLPNDYQVQIYDLDMKNIIDDTYGSFSFASGSLNENNLSERHFRLVISNAEIFEPDDFTSIPTEFLTASCYPNPFNPQTTIQYTLSESANVTITVFNSVGQQVLRHNVGTTEVGVHNFIFDASEYTTGTYFYRVETDKSAVAGKMLYMK
ncbi:Ser-Thr-rich GPI-anchored membrane family protein [Candidatus Latescibacterota bacterium]